MLVSAPWPGNVRQLRNLIESMVVLAPGAEIRAGDIPRDVLEGAGRLLPVRMQPGAGRSEGQEVEFILRSLMELKLQVEELRRRLDGQERAPARMVELTPRAEIGEISVTPHRRAGAGGRRLPARHDNGGGGEGGYRRCAQGVPGKSPTGGGALGDR